MANERTPLSGETLEEKIEAERSGLLEVHALLKCLYEVLLYADDDDSISHADVANVAARLIKESVGRLETLVASCKTEASADG